MSTSKSWLQNEWDTNRKTLLDTDKGLYELTHAKQAVSAARDVTESVDGGAGELLKAIEKAIEELTEPFDPDRLYTGLGTLRKALAAHKARITTPPLSRNSGRMTMTNQTPPAWITRVAEDNHNINTGGMSYRQAIHERELLVMAHAPDAEALAVAVEILIEERDWISEEDWQKCNEVVAAYRARFPKVTP